MCSTQAQQTPTNNSNSTYHTTATNIWQKKCSMCLHLNMTCGVAATVCTGCQLPGCGIDAGEVHAGVLSSQ
jgi:hypothetical protein